MKTRKIMAVALAAMMFMGSALALQGCKKTGSQKVEIVIKKDDPWYSSNEVDLVELCGAKEFNTYHFSDPAFAGDYILTTIDGYKYDKENDMIIGSKILCVINTKGELVRKINMDDLLESNDSEYLGCVVENDKLYVYYTVEDLESNSCTLYKMCIDSASGEAGDPEEVKLNLNDGEQIYQMMMCGGYVFFVAAGNSSKDLFVMKDGEIIFEKDIKDDVAEDYPNIAFMEQKEDKIELIFSDVTLTYDTKANTLDRTESSDLYYMKRYGNKISGSDGREYETGLSGIYSDGESYLNYSDTDGNLYHFNNSKLCKVDPDQIVMFSNDYDELNGEYEANLIILDKQDENPNAGKKVIKAASAQNSIDEMTAEGIRRFNTENSDYYIKLTGKSLLEDPEFDPLAANRDKYEQYENDFKMSLMQNEGPDIIFGVDQIDGLASDDYLLNLKDDIKLDPNIYYTNITDKMTTNGEVYYIPLSFYVDGILTDKSYVKDGAKGFTFEEYKKFVDEVCNGTDPISEEYNKESYLATCLAATSDMWIKDGKADFDQEEFRQLAEYIRDNVPDISNLEDEDGVMYFDDEYMTERMESKAMLSNIFNSNSLISDSFNYKTPVLMGYPSSDGRGCSAATTSTIGICASTLYKEACIDFINVMMSEDIQSLCIDNPINRIAASNIVDKVIEGMKNEYQREITDMGVSEIDAKLWGYYIPDPGIKDDYLSILDNVEHAYSFDDQVLSIINEEAGAYFSGQKDMDSFISILENRVQTMLDERD